MSRILLDSNIIIYLFKSELDDAFLVGHKIVVSEISILEVLGFYRLKKAEQQAFEKFFSKTETIEINSKVIRSAVELRQQRNMSLRDAIIGASAQLERITLYTRNIKDFEFIEGISLRNPFK